MVGVTGIVLQETESAFLLITKANRLKGMSVLVLSPCIELPDLQY